MDRNTDPRLIEIAPATMADDAELRALLRDNAMPSWVSISLEREPSFFAGIDRFGTDHAAIARHDGATVGMYWCAEHRIHRNGEPATVGYLAGLRVHPAYRHRLRVLREGYDSIGKLAATPPPFWYTTIAAGNLPARRLLEANLHGMPRYTPIGELVTLALPRDRGRRLGRWRAAQAAELDDLCATHNTHARRYQLAPTLGREQALATGARFFVAPDGGDFGGTMALWNQQAYKQAVARAYRRPLALALPLYNAWARLSRRVPLPRLGRPLDQSYMAFFANASTEAGEVVPLVRDALAHCATEVMTLGLGATHPALPALCRAFKPLTYRSIVYAVSFAEAPEFDARPVQPEVAIL